MTFFTALAIASLAVGIIAAFFVLFVFAVMWHWWAGLIVISVLISFIAACKIYTEEHPEW